MLSTVSSVNQLISAEIDSGIDPGRIVIGGFSQGGAIGLLTGLTNERKLGGVVCLSGWVALKSKLKGVSSFMSLGTHSDTTFPDVFSARVVHTNLLGSWHC